ncbi:MAG: GNAT family N-acetyltransferase [Thermoplasmata archaeon]
MDLARYSVRPFGDADYDAVARIMTANVPQSPETAEEGRHWDGVLRKSPDRVRVKLIVEEAGTGAVAGFGILSHTLFDYHPHQYWVRVGVDPAHQGRGVGREVYARLEKEAVGRNALALRCSARADDVRSVQFLERQGFVTRRKVWLSRLDLTALDLSGFPDRSKALGVQGIRITTLAAEGADQPENRRRLYQLARITSEDVPRMGEYTPASFEEFVEMDVGGPKAIPEAIFVACDGEEYVAWSTLERELGSPDTIGIGFTGTLPKYRGRGIASELKRRAVEHARSLGYRYLITGNDSLSRPIWAINEKLGFRPMITWVNAEKVFSPAGP